MYFSTSISLCVCITLFIALIVKSHACNSYFIFYQVASMEKVSAVIALGYPMLGLNGLRGVCCQISQIVVNDVWFIDSGAHNTLYVCDHIISLIYMMSYIIKLMFTYCWAKYACQVIKSSFKVQWWWRKKLTNLTDMYVTMRILFFILIPLGRGWCHNGLFCTDSVCGRGARSDMPYWWLWEYAWENESREQPDCYIRSQR